MNTCEQCKGDRVIWEESINERPWEKARSMYKDELEAGYKSVCLLDGIVG